MTILTAFVWLINGLVCKLLDLVPRHRQIVAAILGDQHSAVLTKLIGVSEIFMAIWIVSGYFRKLNVWTQVIIIAVMNLLEFVLVPHLLLWGRFNLLFAGLLIIIILVNEFQIRKIPRRHDES